MEEFITKYYGVDWIAMTLAFTSIYMLGKKNRNGFIVGVFACLAWGLFGYMAQSLADMIANIIMTTIYAKGYLLWKKDDDAKNNNVG